MRVRTGAGGGAFTIQDNIELVLNHGVTVWLDAPFDVMERRIAQDTHRPLARDPVRMKTLFDQRRWLISIASE